MKRKIVLALGVAVLVCAEIILWPKAKQFLDVDACLDSGGRYDDALKTCDFGKGDA